MEDIESQTFLCRRISWEKTLKIKDEEGIMLDQPITERDGKLEISIDGVSGDLYQYLIDANYTTQEFVSVQELEEGFEGGIPNPSELKGTEYSAQVRDFFFGENAYPSVGAEVYEEKYVLRIGSNKKDLVVILRKLKEIYVQEPYNKGIGFKKKIKLVKEV